MNRPSHRIILIAGPTAVGKTEVALSIATRLQAPIVSFDSRQCYRELCIGVARPDREQLQNVPHYFIADHAVEEPVNAAYYERYATEKVAELSARYGQVVMVGGTGLYWKAFWQGLDAIPEVDPAVRTEIETQYKQQGIGWLQRTLSELDPLFASEGEMLNPRRMMRALEVMRTTHKSILTFQGGSSKQQPYQVVGIGLQLPRPELYRRIGDRVDNMIKQGLLEEVQSLEKYSKLNALNTVGYSELFKYLQKDISLIDAIAEIKQNTRQYAKRQMTWFTKDPMLKWFAPDQLKEIFRLL